MKLNEGKQTYKGVPLYLIPRKDYKCQGAKRYTLGVATNQNVWIPNCYLKEDGTLKEGINIDWIFIKAYNQKKFEYAKIDINPYDWK